MSTPHRNTVFWWVYIVVLLVVASFIAYSFVGVLVLGLFGYYATRPICTRFHRRFDAKGIAAALTVLTILLPLLLLTFYVGLRMLEQVQMRFEGDLLEMLLSRVLGIDLGAGPGELLQDPPSLSEIAELLLGSTVQQGLQVLDALFGTILLLALAVTLSYALLVYDETLSGAFTDLVGGRDQTVYAYAVAVDTDLESIFFGNLLFVLVMSVVATATYFVTNLLAPPGLAVPMVFTLGFLTGLTSLIPIVVSKVVYLPIVGFLALSTAESGGEHFLFVGGVLVAYFLVLDILPQSFLQPYISGRQLNPMLLLFAYILGPILFGWYGFFLFPILLVLMLEVVRIVLPELLHGEPIVAEPEVAEGTGAAAETIHEESRTRVSPELDGGETEDRPSDDREHDERETDDRERGGPTADEQSADQPAEDDPTEDDPEGDQSDADEGDAGGR